MTAPFRTLLLARLSLACAIAAGATLRAQSPPNAVDLSVWSDTTIVIDPMLIKASRQDDDYDETGMGVLEAEQDEPPFSNSLIGGVWRDETNHTEELSLELGQIAGINPVELATGVGRTNLRGFPTPRLRNGFIQQGIPEVLDVQRLETIQGPLTQVTGRAAPGGIQNFMTARPRPRPARVLRIEGRTSGRQSLRAEANAPLVPRKVWYRVATTWNRSDGPLAFAHQDAFGLHGALTVRHSRQASTLVQLDYTRLDASIAPAVPEYRPSRTAKIVGPYLPLAEFNSAGPRAGVSKHVAHASVQFEAQRSPAFSYRASFQGYWRDLVEERWTLGQFLLDQQVFGGTREPIRTEQPLLALAGQFDANWRVALAGTEHRILASITHNWVDYDRIQRGLTPAERTQLPADVRSFDPFTPNYFRPDYSPETFQRLITDRTEITSYSTLALSDRAAWIDGRIVTTLGTRADWVELKLDDRRPAAAFTAVQDEAFQATWHGGINYVLRPNRLLLFSNFSTAFYPSTRVDARTAQLQGNATTRGLEFGARGVAFAEKLHFTTLVFALKNQNISRRNPLYNDPIQDTNLTQPELVAAGEEEFLGGVLDVRAKLTDQWSLNGRVGYTRATTTKSPDLPEEEGRLLTRIPSETLSLQTNYAFPAGQFSGLNLGGGVVYVGDYVHAYEGPNREYLAYPDYTLLNFSAAYRWREGKRAHAVGVNVRNALDRDLLASHARTGAERDFGLNYSLTF